MSGDIDAQRIEICELELSARVGVPAEERANLQRLTASLTLWPAAAFDELNDDIANAIDYAAVCDAVKELVSRREDKLIETLADAIARELLRTYALDRVQVELRKFILADTKHVAVIVARARATGG
jgi:dihydroneopterin aldolase